MKLYTLILALLFGVTTQSPAQTYTVLQNFGSDAQLIQGFSGYLFGVDSHTQGTYGYGGSLFRMTPAGKVSTVYTFCSLPDCADGQNPQIVLGADGNIYGVARTGGENSSIDCSGEEVQTCGTIFKITPSTGELTTLYSFCSLANCADGSLPASNLVQGYDGNFYGTTSYGGTGGTCFNNGTEPVGCGTIYKITPQGALTTLYSFCNPSCTDGADPIGNLVQAYNGNLYGTTNFGGTVSAGPPYCGSSPCGNIFEITPQGVLTSLYNFCSQQNCADGGRPTGLVLAGNGVLYGTAGSGGANNEGAVFAFTTSNVYSTVYSFCAQAGCPDGERPGPLTQASDGELYGSTPSGGANSAGTLFKITHQGNLTTLYNFCSQTNCFDGIAPNTPLFQYTAGAFYGAAGGGNPGNGVIYDLKTGAPPFVATLPAVGKAGKKVTILGVELTGATAVTFNGTEATFTVDSSTEITATVPAGGTTGPVKVTTPSGTFSTIELFLVP